MIGPVLDASGVAVTDGVVADFEGSVNGGDPAALNGSATLTHRGVGFYSLALTATDLATVGSFEVTINDTVNACPMKELTVIEEAVYDALFAASANGFAGAAGSSTVTFSNTSIATVTTATNVTTVNGLAANVITAAATAADFGTEIAGAVWNEDATGHQTQGSFGQTIGDSVLDGSTVHSYAAAIKVQTQAIETDTQDIQARIPAVLVGGRIDANVATIGASAITAASIASDAITAAKIADGAIDAATFAAGAINAAAIAADAITDAKVASDVTIASVTGAVGSVVGHTPQTGDSFARLGAAGAGLTALGDTRLANLDAAVSSRMATYTQPTGFLAASFPTDPADQSLIVAATNLILADTNAILIDTAEIGTAGDGLTAINLPNQTMDITGNITGNLSGTVGSVTGAVGSVTGNVGGNVTGTIGGLTAAALKDFFDTDSATTYASAVAGSVVKEIADNAGGGTPPTAAAIAIAVWDEVLADHLDAGSTGNALNAAGSAGDPWATTLPGAYGANSAGRLIGRSLPDVVAGAAGGLFIAGTNAATTITTALTTTFTGSLTGSVGSVTGAVGSISGVTFPANFAALSITAGGLVDITQAAADKAWGTTTRVLTAGTNIVLAKGTGVTGFTDLSAAQVESEVNDALLVHRLDELLNADSDIDGAAPPTVGSVFHELLTKTAGSFTYDQTTDSLEAIRDRGDLSWVTATGFSTLDAAGVRTAVGLASANLDTQLGDLPTNAELTTALGTADDAILTQVALVKASTDLVTSARMGALTDWIDGGRLDLLLDAVKAKTDSLTFTVAGIVDSNALRWAGTVIVATSIPVGTAAGAASGLAIVGSAMALTSAYDMPLAHLKFLNDPAGSENEYQATFTLNGIEIIPTSATIQVVKPDGTNLIASTAMTKAVGAADTIFKLNTATVQVSGLTYKVKITFLYNAVTYTPPALYAQGRDST